MDEGDDQVHYHLQVRVVQHVSRQGGESAAPEEEQRAVEPSQLPLARLIGRIHRGQAFIQYPNLLFHLCKPQSFLVLLEQASEEQRKHEEESQDSCTEQLSAEVALVEGKKGEDVELEAVDKAVLDQHVVEDSLPERVDAIFEPALIACASDDEGGDRD